MSTKKFLIIFFSAFFGVFAAVGGILLWVFYFAPPMQSPGIDAAVARLGKHPRFAENVGAPLKVERARGGVSESWNSKVVVELGLSGPKGKAEIDLVAFRLGKGPWEITTLDQLTPAGPVDLLTEE